MFCFNVKFVTYCFFVSSLLLFCPSCLKKAQHSTCVDQQSYVPIFVAMPQNNFVFDNVAPMVYKEFFEYFQQIGYHVVDDPGRGYVLQTTIKKLDPSQKYVSPDVLPFYIEMRLELFCQLCNFAKEVVAEKNFYFSTLICKPRNPILTSSFFKFEYEKLLRQLAPRVEHYFRQFLKKNNDEKKY